jgi:hypothetical protein
MTLLLGLLFATGVVLAAHDLLAGPPATSFANEIMREDRERAQNFSFIGLILTLPATLLLVPGAVALFFRWRRARPLATIAVVYAVFAWALLGLVTIMQGGYAKPAAAVVGAIWLMWAGFILFSIWRRSVALEFSPVDLQEGNSRSIEHR